jgi:hypothetical protein
MDFILFNCYSEVNTTASYKLMCFCEQSCRSNQHEFTFNKRTDFLAKCNEFWQPLYAINFSSSQAIRCITSVLKPTYWRLPMPPLSESMMTMLILSLMMEAEPVFETLVLNTQH